MERKFFSQMNRLDEVKLRTATFREAVATVYSLFRDGYGTEDVKSLKEGLDVVGIRGDPLLSIICAWCCTPKHQISLRERVY